MHNYITKNSKEPKSIDPHRLILYYSIKFYGFIKYKKAGVMKKNEKEIMMVKQASEYLQIDERIQRLQTCPLY